MLTAPAGSSSSGISALSGIGIAPGQEGMESAQIARLRAAMTHRFTSGRIEIRVDGATTRVTISGQ